MINQERSRRKPTGGLYRPSHKKKLRWMGRLPTLTQIGEKKLKVDRVRGGNKKYRLLSINKANVLDPETGTCKVADIINVLDNPANRHYARRNIITKGSIIETSIGKAKVTSRPGQEGIVNAILIK